MSALTSLLPARAASAWPTASASARGENGSWRSVRPAASALAASTISEESAARCSAPLLTAFAHSRSRWPRSDDASNSASATMPVSGVRMSWAMPASAASTARGDGALRARRACVALARLACALPCAFASPLSPSPDGGQCQTAQSSPTSRRISAGLDASARAARANPWRRSISTVSCRRRRGSGGDGDSAARRGRAAPAAAGARRSHGTGRARAPRRSTPCAASSTTTAR